MNQVSFLDGGLQHIKHVFQRFLPALVVDKTPLNTFFDSPL